MKILATADTERDTVKAHLIDEINKLSENEKKALVLYYYENLNMKEISKVLGIKESTASYIHRSAIQRQKARLRESVYGISVYRRNR